MAGWVGAQIIIEIDRTGTLRWNNPVTNGADRYTISASTNLNHWTEPPVATGIRPAAAVQGRFAVSAPGVLASNASLRFFRIEGEGFPGESCPGAEVLPDNLTANHTTIGYTNDASAYSAPGFSAMTGPDRFYLSRIPGRNRLSFTVTPEAGFDPGIIVFSHTNCGAATIPAILAINSAGVETLSITNNSFSSANITEVVLSVDSAGDPGGSYQLAANIISLYPGESPATAELLTLPANRNGTIFNYLRDISNECFSSFAPVSAGPDRFYIAHLQATSRLSIAVSPTCSFDPKLGVYLTDAAGSSNFTCIGESDSGSSSATEKFQYYNDSSSTSQPVLIRITSYTTSLCGDFSLTASLLAPPPGDFMTRPLEITASGIYPGTLDFYANRGSGQFTLPDRYYRVTVPPGERVSAILNPNQFVGGVNILPVQTNDYAAVSYLVESSSISTSGYVQSSAWLNTNIQPVEVLIEVRSKNAFYIGAQFSLDVQIGPPPEGDMPATATVITNNSLTSLRSTLGYINDVRNYTAGFTNLAGNDRFFRATVPPQSRFALNRINLDTTFQVYYVLLDAEAAASNHVVVLDGPGSITDTSAAFWDNTNEFARDIVIGVDTLIQSGGGTFYLSFSNAPINPGERMQNAEYIAASTSVVGSTAAYFDDVNVHPGATVNYNGIDRFYRVRVPAGEQVAAILTPTNWNPRLLVLDGASTNGNTGLFFAQGGGTNFGTQSVVWRNNDAVEREVLIAIDAYKSTFLTTFDSNENNFRGPYGMEFRIGPVPESEGAGNPALVSGALATNHTLYGFTNDMSSYAGIPFTIDGPDRFYSVDIPPFHKLFAVVSNLNFDAVLILLNRANVTQVFVSADNVLGNSGVESLVYFNSSTSTVAGLLVVEAWSSAGGNYALNASVMPVPEGEQPANATVLAGTMSVTGTTFSYLNDTTIYAGAGISNAPGPDRFYRVGVPPGERLTAYVSPSNFNSAIALLDAASLDPSNLLVLAATDASFATGSSDATGWDNTNATSKDVVIAIDGMSTAQSGSFLLNVRVGAPQLGDLLSQPEPLASTGTVNATTLGFMNDLETYAPAAHRPGIDRFYSISVPTNTRLIMTFTNRLFDGTMAVLDGDAALTNTVQTLRVSQSVMITETMTWANASTTNIRPVIISIDAPVTNAAGDFRLTTTFTNLTAGDTPENAIVMTSGQTFTGNTAFAFFDDISDYGFDAFTNTIYPDIYFRITVPAGERLLVTTGPNFTRGFDTSIFLMDAATLGSTSFVVLAAADNFNFWPGSTSATEYVGWENTTTNDRDIIIGVDSSGILSQSGEFRISTHIGTRPPGDTPESAGIITNFPASITGTTTGHMNDVASYVTNSSEIGLDRYFRVTIPPGERLFASLATTNRDAVVILYDASRIGLPYPGRLMRSNQAGSNGVEFAGFINTNATAIDVMIAIEMTFPGGNFQLSAQVENVPPGETPALAEVISGSGAYNGSTTNYLPEFFIAYGSLYSFLPGPDRFYRTTIPAGERLLAKLEPAGRNDLLLVDYETTTSSTNWSIISASNRAATNGSENVGAGNITTTNRDVLIIIPYSDSSGWGSSSTLNILLGPGPAGDAPSSPVNLAGGGISESASYTNLVDDVAIYGTLTNTFGGRDAFYRTTIPPDARINVRLNGTNANAALLIAQTNGVSPADWKVLAVSDTSSSGQESTGWRNNSGEDADVMVVVDGQTESSSTALGGYGIVIDIEAAPIGDSRANAQVVDINTNITGFTTNYLDDINAYAGTSNLFPGRDRFYQVTIPAGERLLVTLAHTNANAALLILTTNLVVLREVDDSSSSTTREFGGWINTSTQSVDVFVVVDSRIALAGVTYSLRFESAPAPAGDLPTLAELLPGSGSYNSFTTNYLNDIVSYSGLAGYSGRDRFYRVAVPPGERVFASVSPSNFNAALIIIATNGLETGAVTRLASSDVTTSFTGRENAGWGNNSGEAQEVIIAVDSATLNTGGIYRLDVELGVPPPGDSLQLPQIVTNQTVTNNLTNLRDDVSRYYLSFNTFVAPDWFGQVEVPAGMTLTAEIKPTAGFNADIHLLPESAKISAEVLYLAYETSASALETENAIWVNTNTSTTNVIIVVDGLSSTNTSTYAISIFVGSQARGESPASAETLTSTGITHGTTEDYTNDVSRTNNCNGLSTPGEDRFYRIDVPAGQTLTASVNPFRTFYNPMIYLLRESELLNPEAACLDANDSGGNTTTNVVSYSNSSIFTETIVIGIDSQTSDSSGTYRLTTALGPP